MKRHLPFVQPQATRWLLPGAPERAGVIAGHLDQAVCLGQSREFTAYEGYHEGIPIGVCSTGIGPASTAIAAEDLVASGATHLIRVGTCGALTPKVKVGDVCVATGAVRADGTAEAYAPLGFPAVPDFMLTARLSDGADHLGVTFSSAAFHREPDTYEGASFVEMEAATLFVITHLAGVAAGCVCVCVNDHEGWTDGEPSIDRAIRLALWALT